MGHGHTPTARRPQLPRVTWLCFVVLLISVLSLQAANANRHQSFVPTITSLSPAKVQAGGEAFTLTVSGSNFAADASVRWNGAPRPTTVLSSTQLSAAIPASDIATVGRASISVVNGPSGRSSPPVNLPVNAPATPVNRPSTPGAPVNLSVTTPAGSVGLTFEGVETDGSLSVDVVNGPPPQPVSATTLLQTSYEVSVQDLTFDAVTVCFPYSDTEVIQADVPEPALRLLHYENGAWQDITTTLTTDDNRICGSTSSLSPFAIGAPTNQYLYLPLIAG